VNTVYGVQVEADDEDNGAKPGESVTYEAEITNTGNTNETYKLTNIKHDLGSEYNDAKQWATIVGADEDDCITVPTGDTVFIQVRVDIPDFTPDDDEAEAGVYAFTLQGESRSDRDITSDITFTLTVQKLFNITMSCENPYGQAVVEEFESTTILYTVFIRNLGNAGDVIELHPDQSLSAWGSSLVSFGNQREIDLDLQPFQSQSVLVEVDVDSTHVGNHKIYLEAESYGDSSVHVYLGLYLNITCIRYDVDLEAITTTAPRVDPSNGTEVEFQFTLSNTGDVNDAFTLKVATPLIDGTYHNWKIYFRDRHGNETQFLRIPEDINGLQEMANSSWLNISVFVVVDFYEEPGNYQKIEMSAASQSYQKKTDNLSFCLEVVRPDLIPLDITFSDSTSGVENATVTVEIGNTGRGFYVPGEATIRLTIGEKDLRSIHSGTTFPIILNHIHINESTNIEFTWDIPLVAGPLAVLVTIDYPQDMNTTNNYLITSVIIRSDATDPTVIDPIGPDLAITNFTSKNHKVGQEMAISIGVLNYGDTTADASVFVYLSESNSTLLGTVEVNIPYQSGTTVTVNWTPKKGGETHFLIRIHDVLPEERNDQNNEQIFTVEVSEEDSPDDDVDDDSDLISEPYVVVMIVAVGITILNVLFLSRKGQQK